MMGLELPAVGATMARLADAELHLAAFGGIVFPLSLLIEAPIIMMLSASTALSRSWTSYRKLRRFVFASGGALTLLHVAVVATPLYELVTAGALGAPEEIVGPARIGLWIMTPWTLAIAYRRFQQGVLIRFGRSRWVGIGTAVRLGTNLAVLVIGLASGGPGIVVGTLAVASGVLAEAIFAGWAVRPILRDRLPEHDPHEIPLTRSRFLHFYAPLAFTSVLQLGALSIGSAAMSRMPRPIESLAVWPVINGLTFTLRSLGFAFNEVVVALLDREGAVRALVSVARKLAFATTALLLLVAATPLAHLWFGVVSGLSEPLADLATSALWISVLMPGIAVVQSWFQGVLVHAHRTRGVSEAVVAYLVANATALAIGIHLQLAAGIYVGLASALLAGVIQTGWLAWRSRPVLRALPAADRAVADLL